MIDNKCNKLFAYEDLGEININNIDKFIKDHRISTGEFKNIYLGNTFDIIFGGEKKKIIIIGFDSMMNISTNKHHIICMPIDDFGCFYMNSKDISDKCDIISFTESDMFNVIIPKINKNLEDIFGNHLLTTKEVLENGKDSIGLYDCKSILLSEKEIFGKNIFSKEYKEDKSKQFPFFKFLKSYKMHMKLHTWLRNKEENIGIYHCYCKNNDCSRSCYLSSIHDVRPRFLIG